MSYDADFVRAVEFMWGEGFLSPGGPGELAAILDGLDIVGHHVLDVGCGIGGFDALLIESHGAARVTGIDVEPALVDHARRLIASKGLADRVALEVVEAGPLGFGDASFDTVFTKDSLIHVEDKLEIYREIRRVLRPGGVFVGSDWLGNGEPPSREMREWLDVVTLDFELCSAAELERLLVEAGFVDVRTADRNAWYREAVRGEVAAVSGDGQARLAAVVGEDTARHRLESSLSKRAIVDSGELRPTHLRARRP